MQINPSRKFKIVEYYPSGNIISTVDGQKIINLAFLVNIDEALRRDALVMRVFLLNPAAKAMASQLVTTTGNLVDDIEKSFRHRKSVVSFGKDRAYVTYVDLSQVISNEAISSSRINVMGNNQVINGYFYRAAGSSISSTETQALLNDFINNSESYDPTRAAAGAEGMLQSSMDPANFLNAPLGNHGTSTTCGEKVIALETPNDSINGTFNSLALSLRRGYRLNGSTSRLSIGALTFSTGMPGSAAIRGGFLSKGPPDPSGGVVHRLFVPPKRIVYASFYVDDEFLRQGFTLILAQVLSSDEKRLIQKLNLDFNIGALTRLTTSTPTGNRLVTARANTDPIPVNSRCSPPVISAIIENPGLNIVTLTQTSPAATGIRVFYRTIVPGSYSDSGTTGLAKLSSGPVIPIDEWMLFYENMSTPSSNADANFEVQHIVDNSHPVMYRAYALCGGEPSQEFSSAMTTSNRTKESNRNVGIVSTGSDRLNDQGSVIATRGGIGQITVNLSKIPSSFDSAVVYRLPAIRVSAAAYGAGVGPDWLNDPDRHVVGQYTSDDGMVQNSFGNNVTTDAGIIVTDNDVEPGVEYVYRAVFSGNGSRYLGKDLSIARSKSEADIAIEQEVFQVPTFEVVKSTPRAPVGFTAGRSIKSTHTELELKIGKKRDIFEDVFRTLKRNGISDELLAKASANRKRFNDLFFVDVIRTDINDGISEQFPIFEAFNNELTDPNDPNALMAKFTDNNTIREQFGITAPKAGHRYEYNFRLRAKSPLTVFDGILDEELEPQTRVRFTRSLSKYYDSLNLPKSVLPSTEEQQRMSDGVSVLADDISRLPIIAEATSEVTIPSSGFKIVNAKVMLSDNGTRLISWGASTAQTSSIDHFVISIKYNGHIEPIGVISNHAVDTKWTYIDTISPPPIGNISYDIASVTKNNIYGSPTSTNVVSITAGIGSLGNVPVSMINI